MIIIFEGAEASGKTTQLKLFLNKLTKEIPNKRIITYADPGGTDIGLKFREILLNPNFDVDPMTQIFMFKANDYSIIDKINKAPKDNIYLLDRFYFSTLAYQKASFTYINSEYSNRWEKIEPIIKDIHNDLLEQLKKYHDVYLFFFDTNLEDIMKRIKETKGNDRFEQYGESFFLKILEEYNKEIVKSKKYTKIFNSSFYDIEDIKNQVWEEFKTIYYHGRDYGKL